MTRAAIALCLLLLSPAGQDPTLPGPLLSLDCDTKLGQVLFEQFAEGFVEVRISHDDILIDPVTGGDSFEESWYVARVYAGTQVGIEHWQFTVKPGWWYRVRAQRKSEPEPQTTHWMRCEP